MANTIDIEAALAQLRQEYVDNASDRIDEIDANIKRLRGGGPDWKSQFLDLQRSVHTIKGSAGSYGFAVITQIAHRLEDYIEAQTSFEARQIDNIQIYVDRIRELFERGQDPDDKTAKDLFKRLPSAAEVAADSGADVLDLMVLLVMPKGVQRAIIARELSSMGMRTSLVDTGVAAIQDAVATRPDIVLSSMELADIDGAELANVLHVIKATNHSKFLIMTSHDDSDDRLVHLPEGTAVVHKGTGFASALQDYLLEWSGLD